MNKDNFFKRFNHIDMINNGGKNPFIWMVAFFLTS